MASSPQSEPFTPRALAGDCLDHHDDGVDDDNDCHSKVFTSKDNHDDGVDDDNDYQSKVFASNDNRDDGVDYDGDYHSKVFACRAWSSPALRSPE